MIAVAVIGGGRLVAPASASSARTAASSLLVVALAELDVADLPLGVDQVLGRPVLVLVRVPGAVVVVLDDRVVDPVGADRLPDVARLLLERELGRLDADDVEAVAGGMGVQALEERERAHAVDARVGPEVDQHDVAAQPGERQRPVAGGVEPVLGVGEVGRGAEVGERRGLDARDRDLALGGGGDRLASTPPAAR